MLDKMNTLEAGQDVDSLKYVFLLPFLWSSQAFRNDIARLTQEVTNNNVRLSRLIGQRDKMASLHTSISHRYPSHWLRAIFTKCPRNVELDKYLEDVLQKEDEDVHQSYGASVNEVGLCSYQLPLLYFNLTTFLR